MVTGGLWETESMWQLYQMCPIRLDSVVSSWKHMDERWCQLCHLSFTSWIHHRLNTFSSPVSSSAVSQDRPMKAACRNPMGFRLQLLNSASVLIGARLSVRPCGFTDTKVSLLKIVKCCREVRRESGKCQCQQRDHIYMSTLIQHKQPGGGFCLVSILPHRGQI